MNTYVLDASVAAKWFLPPEQEALGEKASDLFKEQTAGRLRFIVPELFWTEMGNVLWKAARVNRMSRSAAERAFASLLKLQFPTLSSTTEVLDKAFRIALRFERTFYDSVYLALAETSGWPLITADERLANAVAAYLPVRWLGAI